MEFIDINLLSASFEYFNEALSSPDCSNVSTAPNKISICLDPDLTGT